MKRAFFFLMASCLFVLCTSASNISGGTTLYLDASNAWTNYNDFSAYFWSSNSNGNYVQMTPVAGESRIWQVVAPAGTWTNVIFRCHTAPSGNGTGVGTFVHQTEELTWGGNKSLYQVNCDECGYSNHLSSKIAKGDWNYFIPLPTTAPTTLGSGEIITDCLDSTESTTLKSDININEFVNYQWFRYENGQWERIAGKASITAAMPTVANDTVYYYMVAQRMIGNRIVNPGFESGNTGFTSDYGYVSPNGSSTLYPEGVYTITNEMSSVHTSAQPNGFDHTMGNSSGHMMAVNGDSNTGKIVWEQTINNIRPNTNYVFSAWVMNWDQENANMAELEFSINGTLQGGRFSPIGGYYNWTQLYTTWNSGSATSVTIKLVNQQGAANGNDFAIDDICFSEIEEYTLLKKLVVTNCEKEDPVVPEPELPCEEDLVYAKWGDVLFCDNGDNRFVAYQWYKDNVKMDGETMQYIYQPAGMGESEYYVEAIDQTGVRHKSCPKTFEETQRSATQNGGMRLHRKGSVIQVQCSVAHPMLTLYDVAGKLIMEKEVVDGEEIVIPTTAGIYLICIENEYEHITQKMCIY